MGCSLNLHLAALAMQRSELHLMSQLLQAVVGWNERHVARLRSALTLHACQAGLKLRLYLTKTSTQGLVFAILRFESQPFI
jgi:hypothetical protein